MELVTAWEKEQGLLVHPGVSFAGEHLPSSPASVRAASVVGQERAGREQVLGLQLYQGASAEGLGGDMLGAAGTLLPQRGMREGGTCNPAVLGQIQSWL